MRNTLRAACAAVVVLVAVGVTAPAHAGVKWKAGTTWAKVPTAAQAGYLLA